MDVVFPVEKPDEILLSGRNIAGEVRLESSGERASVVAAIPEVRQALLDLQLGFRRQPGLVADGRDMGTVVFPDAPLKLYLTASARERAERRYKQLITKGVCVSLSGLLEDIQIRDERDRTRTVSPLRPASDAIVIDTSETGIDQVLEIALVHVYRVFQKQYSPD
jgi:cytidylate kinase